MADETTPNLSLVKPDVGGSDDTWGIKLNSNFDKIDVAFSNIPVFGEIATKEYVDSENNLQDSVISLKADQAYVDSQNTAQNNTINLKADKTYVDTENTTQNNAINLKADKTYVDTQDALKVAKAGDVMTGFLQLNADPTSNLHAATKQYVDANVGTGGGDVTQAYVDAENAEQDVIINLKADKTYVDTENAAQNSVISGKANTVHSHVASDISNFSEAVDDRVSGLLVAGSNITLTYDDTSNILTVASTASGSGDVTKAYVDAENAEQDAVISLKADSTYVDSQNTTQNTVIFSKVAKAGDTMTGFLTLNAAPTSNLHAATKKYVDDNIGSGVAIAFIGDAPPVSPVNGQLWWESDTGFMFIYFGSHWVPVATTPYIPIPTVAAPVLDLTSNAEDLTPDFTLTGDLVLDDLVRFQYSTAADFTGATELTNTIDAAEDAAEEIDFSTGELAIGVWYFRARIERVGYTNSPWSNVETIDLTGPLVSPEAQQFLDRTTGLDTLHTDACAALIDGFVADGTWSIFDAIYLYAGDATNKLLNVKSSLYSPAVVVGTMSFTPDVGFQLGVTGTDYVNTTFNPFVAGGNYGQDDAHFSVFVTEGTVGGAPVGTLTGPNRQYLMPNYASGGTGYFRINTNGGVGGTVSNGTGHFLANRLPTGIAEGYHDGNLVASGTDASAALNDAPFTHPDISVIHDNSIIHAATFGKSMTAAQVLSVRTRLRTYLTTVGVP